MPPDTASPDESARHEGWRTLTRFLPYLWPADRPGLRWRIVGAILLILAAKAVTLALPFAYKRAIDSMAVASGPALTIALAFVLAYALGRFAGVMFDNLRNIVFERVGQDATRALAEDVFSRLHRLSLRFHLARRTGEVTKVIERGTKSIDVMLYFLLFNVAPTAIELIAVVGAWTLAPDAVSPSAPLAPGVTNTVALGRVLYTQYLFFFQAAGMILLTAMVGAIVLTLRHKVVKRQSIPEQNARTQAGVIEIKKVPFRAGV